MILFPKCKINIGLNVVEKRLDGYHNIESIFYPVNLCDALEIVSQDQKRGTITISISGIEILGSSEDNLCHKAYHLLNKQFNLPGIDLFLHKAIPMGAGLGGGSSDGASTLVLLNQLFDLKLSLYQLKSYASQLGSDCAFFIESAPCYVQGRGEELSKIKDTLKDFFVVLINPGIHINTAKAYSFLKPTNPAINCYQVVNEQPIESWKNSLTNDFEKYAFETFSLVKDIKKELYNSGAIYSSMSGSGSTVYGIFNKEVDLKNSFPNYFYWSGKL
jgi:4-diphosphocytidyl-2-C-methyl-D-erythritol kinase